jgi:hypothetical protein
VVSVEVDGSKILFAFSGLHAAHAGQLLQDNIQAIAQQWPHLASLQQITAVEDARFKWGTDNA